VKTLWTLLRRAANEFLADRCMMLAAAISYFVLFSIVPLVTCLVALFGLVLRDPAVQANVVDEVLRAVPLAAGQGENMVIDAIRAVTEISGTLTVVGLAGLIWTSAGMFGAVRDALNIAWDVEAPRRWHWQKLWDIGAVLGLGLLLAGSIGGSAMLHSFEGWSRAWFGASRGLEESMRWAGWLFPAAVSFVAFLLLYRFVPRVKHGFTDVWPGALAGTLAFEASKHGFTTYVAHFSRYEVVYGALGAVMLFMLWTYVSAVILLGGAEIASEWGRMRRERDAAARSTQLDSA
jgi:membrane protein